VHREEERKSKPSKGIYVTTGKEDGKERLGPTQERGVTRGKGSIISPKVRRLDSNRTTELVEKKYRGRKRTPLQISQALAEGGRKASYQFFIGKCDQK